MSNSDGEFISLQGEYDMPPLVVRGHVSNKVFLEAIEMAGHTAEYGFGEKSLDIKQGYGRWRHDFTEERNIIFDFCKKGRGAFPVTYAEV